MESASLDSIQEESIRIDPVERKENMRIAASESIQRREYEDINFAQIPAKSSAFSYHDSSSATAREPEH